jgi:hypothetical protein
LQIDGPIHDTLIPLVAAVTVIVLYLMMMMMMMMMMIIIIIIYDLSIVQAIDNDHPSGLTSFVSAEKFM